LALFVNYYMFEENPVMRVFSFVLLLWVFAACNSANNQHPSTKYEEKKSSLEDMERDSPLKFLKVTGSHRNNLLNQTVLEGEITNKATLVSYKNIALLITWHDKDGSVLEKQKKVLDEVVKPNSTSDFKIKTSHVKGATSVTFDITAAIPDK
jgi:hypothetical protein